VSEGAVQGGVPERECSAPWSPCNMAHAMRMHYNSEASVPAFVEVAGIRPDPVATLQVDTSLRLWKKQALARGRCVPSPAPVVKLANRVLLLN
jgi:hypothetical protein